MNIIFMGTPDFAVPSLKALIDKYGVKAVFTQPDRPKGRGKKVAISDVKQVAVENNIEVYQPVKIKEDKATIQAIKDMKPDFIIVVAFGQILTKEILDIPKYGCINLHGSLLPMYRGAAPINWAIIIGEKVSGNTTMLMDQGLDTGDMLLKDTVQITKEMTAGELYDILKCRGSKLLIDTVEGVVAGSIIPQKQQGETFYAKMLDKSISMINWDLSASQINNLIRGLNPWPIAQTMYKDQIMKIYQSEVINSQSDSKDGTILNVTKKGIEVSCGDGILLIKKIQFPNSKPLLVEQYINGHEIEKDLILG